MTVQVLERVTQATPSYRVPPSSASRLAARSHLPPQAGEDSTVFHLPPPAGEVAAPTGALA